MPPVRPRTAAGSAAPARGTRSPRLLTGRNSTLLALGLAWALTACGLLDEDHVDSDPPPEPVEEAPADEATGETATDAAPAPDAAATQEGEPELDPGAWSPWAMPAGDASAANRASLPGPEQPGLRWWLDLGEVTTAFAPEGYDRFDDRVLLADAGVLVARVSNPEGQYEDTARFRNELIGIDLDTAEVLWEIPNVSPINSGPCMPALDRRDRIWVEQRPDGGDLGSLLNHGSRDHWAVMTSDHLVTLIEIVDDDGDATEHRIVSIALDDGTTTDEITLPTATGIDSTEVDRAYLLADHDRVYLSTRTTGDSQVLALDAAGGELDLDWAFDLELRAPELTLGDGVVLFQDGRRAAGAAPSLTALDVDDGTLVFDDGIAVGAQPLANPDGTLWGRTSGEDSSRMREISRIGADGRLRWQLPWSELALARGEGPQDPERPFVEMAGVDEQGTLLLVSDDGDGLIIALERDGDLAVQEPTAEEDDG